MYKHVAGVWYSIYGNMHAVTDPEVLDSGGQVSGENSANYIQKWLSLVHIFVTILHIFVAYKLN